ncbi:hypothetical protein [Staphylococcus xylosus]|uniref:hypothetical protein n=1 Tax=Staphylococcus xylosus TaxID=1288 RepID=UPI001CDD5FC0|nr:hypothetical protein [Staphylococcus xylosus]MCQ3816967.1 hypothetical protein [Staphylococcus xylosus]MCQ3819723.1 hypothetical protein [Staphylococcus xylosus]UBV37315.1 hypothetical protein JGY88_12960 [Staphylococcus xylosus]
MAVLALILHLVCLLLVLIAGFVALKEFRKSYKERNQRKIDTLLVFVLIVALIAILSSVIIDL